MNVDDSTRHPGPGPGSAPGTPMAAPPGVCREPLRSGCRTDDSESGDSESEEVPGAMGTGEAVQDEPQGAASEDSLAQAGRLLAHLQSQLAELDRRELNLNQQLAALIDQQRSVQQATASAERRATEIQHQLDTREAAVVAGEEELRHRRDDLELRVRKQEECEASLEQQRRTFDEERRRLKAELAQEIGGQRRALAEERRQVELEQREQQRLNEQWAAQRTGERARHLEELDELRRQKLGGLDQRERELDRRAVDVEKRARFHEGHLEKVRRDLDAQRAQLERQRQQQRVWVEQVEQSIRLRLAHMRRFRDLVSQRERCLAEEQQLLLEQRRSAELELGRQRRKFEDDRSQWAQHRSTELDILQKREARLERELADAEASREELHELQTTLKGAIEQFLSAAGRWCGTAAPASAPGEEGIAGDRPISGHLQGLIEILARQQEELETAQMQFRRRLQERRQTGVSLSAWIEEREQRLQKRGSELRADFERLQAKEQAWQAVRDQWQEDRLQAEQVIRGLVVQLETALEEIARLHSDRRIEEPPTRRAA